MASGARANRRYIPAWPCQVVEKIEITINTKPSVIDGVVSGGTNRAGRKDSKRKSLNCILANQIDRTLNGLD
jgi:hypothetical protein